MSINTRQQSLNISQVVSSPIGPTRRPVLRELQLRQPGLVNSRGNPGVSAANPYPTPQKPLPLLRGKGFEGYG